MEHQNPDRKRITLVRLRAEMSRHPEYGTQEKLAEALDVDVKTVRRWLAVGIDSLTKLRRVADLFGIPDITLFT